MATKGAGQCKPWAGGKAQQLSSATRTPRDQLGGQYGCYGSRDHALSGRVSIGWNTCTAAACGGDQSAGAMMRIPLASNAKDVYRRVITARGRRSLLLWLILMTK